MSAQNSIRIHHFLITPECQHIADIVPVYAGNIADGFDSLAKGKLFIREGVIEVTQFRNGYRVSNGVQSRDIDARNVLLTDDYPLVQSCISKRTARPQRIVNLTGCAVITDGMALGEHIVFLLAVAVAVIRTLYGDFGDRVIRVNYAGTRVDRMNRHQRHDITVVAVIQALNRHSVPTGAGSRGIFV